MLLVRLQIMIGITRSVIVNALRKFESAGVIDCKSSGMKGTYIKLLTNMCLMNFQSMMNSLLQDCLQSII